MDDHAPTDRIDRVLIVCTETYSSRDMMGIQRVVRNLALQSVGAGAELGIQCVPVVLRRDQFYVAPLKRLRHVAPPRLAASCRRTVEAVLGHRSGDVVATKVGRWTRRVRKAVVPRSAVRTAVDCQWKFFGRPLAIAPGDLLVVPEVGRFDTFCRTLAAARRAGVPSAVVIYDLLAIDHPELCSDGYVASHRRWLELAIREADILMSISATTHRRLREFIDHRFSPTDIGNLRTDHFRLGSTIEAGPRDGVIRGRLEAVFESGPMPETHLTVGTIEPRKNHPLLLTAFDQVWHQHPDAKLCIVGRIGWKCDEIVRQIKTHPMYGQRLFMFNDVSDTELAYCYRRAKSFVFPSRAEGFGLPIAEALNYQLPVLTSDIPVHREVGRDHCSYFDLDDPAGLAALICTLQDNQPLPHGSHADTRSPESFELPTWTASCREFLQKCLHLAADIPHTKAATAHAA